MLQAVATGQLPNIAAGRAALGESIAESNECVSYAPQHRNEWASAQMRYRKLEAVLS